MSEQLQNLKEYLKETNLEGLESLDYEHQLRRALLNSSFYSGGFVFRWQKRLGINSKNIILSTASASIALGAVFFINVYTLISGPTTPANSQFMSLDNNFSNTTLTSSNLTPKTVFNNWYENGRIEYVRQEQDGTRVFNMRFDDGRMVELADAEPYTVNLVSAP